MTTVVVDGDTICYKACFATEYSTYHLEEEGLAFRYKKDIDGYLALNFDGDETPDINKVKVIEPLSHTYYLVRLMVEGIVNDTGARDCIIFLSGQSNFRYSIPYPIGYKSGRPDKPVHLPDCRSYLVSTYGARIVDGYEADDAIGIYASTHPGTIIASVDKDLRQLAGMHYHLDRKTIEIVEEVDALRSFYRQMLTGDRTDSIIGLDRIGPKTAEKLINHLQTEKEMDEVVRAKYKEGFGENWWEMYHSNFDLLHILRSQEEYEGVKNYYENIKRESEGEKAPTVGEGQDQGSIQPAGS